MDNSEGSQLCFPQLLNASCRKITNSHFEAMLIYILLYCLSLLTVLLNMLVIISISHFKQFHTPTNLLLLSLAVSDFMVGFLVFFQIMLLDGCWFLGDSACVTYQYLAYIITSVSVGNMVLISIDRYVAIFYPMHYAVKITPKRVKTCICLSWLCSAAFQSLNLIDNLKQPGRYNSCVGECVVVIHYISGIADLIFTLIFPVTVIVVLYVRVFLVVLSHTRTMRSQIASVTFVAVKRSEMKAARTLGVVVVVFLICICPFFCVTLAGEESLLNASTATFVICLVYLNSCANPMIYAFFYPWFRKSIKLIVTLKLLKANSSELNIL